MHVSVVVNYLEMRDYCVHKQMPLNNIYTYISLGARPNSSGAKSRELGLGLETLAAFPCALAECGQSQ